MMLTLNEIVHLMTLLMFLIATTFKKNEIFKIYHFFFKKGEIAIFRTLRSF